MPDEQAFEAIKAGVDTLPPGAKMILNSGRLDITLGRLAAPDIPPFPQADFYGEGHSVGNLELLARFYDKYPDYASKTFLSIKVLITTFPISDLHSCSVDAQAIPLFFAPPGKTV